jgi:hypothetical protein
MPAHTAQFIHHAMLFHQESSGTAGTDSILPLQGPHFGYTQVIHTLLCCSRISKPRCNGQWRNPTPTLYREDLYDD